jgi:hypothetical protein
MVPGVFHSGGQRLSRLAAQAPGMLVEEQRRKCHDAKQVADTSKCESSLCF